jgi:hypothetical protein
MISDKVILKAINESLIWAIGRAKQIIGKI